MDGLDELLSWLDLIPEDFKIPNKDWFNMMSSSWKGGAFYAYEYITNI